MANEKVKLGSKLKDLGSMDIKDIGKLFKKNKDTNNENTTVSYGGNSSSKKPKKLEKARLVLSIDMGSNSIKAVEGKLQKGVINVTKLAEVLLPEGAIADGKILNFELVVNALERLIKENSIKARDVIITTNSSSIINRDILIPSVQEEEMDTVVRYEIQQYLPINLDDYIVQFVVLDEIVDDEGVKLKVNVTAFPERVALSYYNLINALDLDPYALDVSYNAINKLANLGEYTQKDGGLIGGPVAFVDMGAASINVSIFKNNKLDFTRMIKMGGDNILYALSERLNMSIKSTEFIKFKDIDLLSEDEENTKNKVVQGVVNELLEELERIIQFYNNRASSKIDKIYIYGGISNLRNINLFLEEKLNTRIQRIEDIKNVNLGNNVLMNRDLSLYLNAIGAIIRL